MSTVYEKNVTLDASANDGTFFYGFTLWLYLLVRWLVDDLGGWVITASSTRGTGAGDADTVDDSDLWGSDYTKPAHGLAWVALYCATRDLAVVLQVGTSIYDCRIKAAYGGQYTTAGGGTATQVPALAGETVIAGGGTDASPSFASAMASGSFVVQSKGDTATRRFKHLVYPAAGGSAGAAGVFFALVELELGDAGATDEMFVVSIGTLPTKATLTDEASGVCWALCQKGEAGEEIVRVKCLEVGSIPGGASASPRTAKKPIARIRVQRDASPADLLGRCVDLYWWGPAGSVVRTGNLSGTKDQLGLGPVCFGWDGSEPA